MTRFSVYLDPDLNVWLEERARVEGRSKARQVAHILKLFKDTIGDHSASLLRPPGYSLQDEQWLSLKGHNNTSEHKMTEREKAAWDKIKGAE